ncbi:peroxidase-like [Daphnia carinata]|uniref:peroxidase-like n=1 Tax=Daphnia carinata TaxID=120202 RepID=UPI0028685E91|nr:peroxidase-like [Daphnia carinata]
MGLFFAASEAYGPPVHPRYDYVVQDTYYRRGSPPSYTSPPPSYTPSYTPPPSSTPTYEEPEPVHYCPNVAGLATSCRPTKDCSVWYDEVLATPYTACKLSDGSAGSCCPDVPYNYKGTPFKEPPACEGGIELDDHVGCLDVFSVNAAVDAGELELRLHKETAKRLKDNDIVVKAASARATHARFSNPSEHARQVNTEAFVGVHTAVVLVKRFKIKTEQVGCALHKFKLSETDLNQKCTSVSKAHCSEDKLNSTFRMIDGSCNNERHFVWGRAATQYHRMLASDYADGVWAPRISRSGAELPSPRLVSTTLVRDEDKPSESTTIWFMQFGQFIDHDIVSTPEMTNEDGTPVTCCGEDGTHLPDADRSHGKCLPIDVPTNDPFFAKFGRTCLHFVRASLACRTDHQLGHAAQLNDNTHFLDLSLVYGSNDKTARELRTGANGELNVTLKQGKGFHKFDLLPQSEGSPLQAPCTLPRELTGVEPPQNVRCFKAGDGRPDVTPNMATSQILFLREHNRLAKGLAELNPSWDDERLYQEARRILIAQAQHITYNEWLPILLGRTKMAELGLLPLQSGFSTDYDDHLNPSILSEFVAGAFRFGHSMVQGKALMVNEQRSIEKDILLRHHFFKPQTLYTPGNLDKYLIGLATQPTQRVDLSFTKELTQHLFEEAGKGFGLDIVALNIQRGRDFGLGSYNDYRELCGVGRATHFDGLTDLIDPVVIQRFKEVYATVDDIDLFVGGVSEAKAEGAYVGPTFQCILADQFLKLKRGDRHFYDLGGQPSSFTEEQLNEIRKTSLARIVCDNSQVEEIQPMVFKMPSTINPIVSCQSSAIPRMSLLPWQEGTKPKSDGYYGGYY